VAFEESVQKRSDSQREVNSLLGRKSMWKDTDVSRFTALVRQDHALEKEEARAKAAVTHTEDEVEREFSALMRTILARYHEEQVWSDKIHNVSTYGQPAVLGVNGFVFVLAIILIDPWKRRRLMQAFEQKVQEMEAANMITVVEGMDTLKSRLEAQDRILARLAEGASALPPPALVSSSSSQGEWVGGGGAARDTGDSRRPGVVFAGITLAHEDAKLIVASVSAGALAWILRGWVGL
jgi:sensitive to high expression protein 9, mitochondrial